MTEQSCLSTQTKPLMGACSPQGGVSNKLDGYEILAFLCFGGDALGFQDDLGNDLEYNGGTVRGTGPVKEVLVVDALTPGDAVQLCGRGLAGTLMRVEERK